jgi:glycosyltransferase involved in cell wall biosynthesis
MVHEMTQSYPKIKDKIIVCSQPVPDWFDKNAKKNSFILNKNKKFKFFYPSAFYPHKMHKFLLSFDNYLLNNKIVIDNIEIYLTLTEKEFDPYKKIKYLKNIGNLSSSEMNNYYGKVDALLFLSSLESYGLPLIEAMSLNLPILTVDLSYSRWVCEDHAYFFKPYDEESFFIALTNLVNDFNSGKKSSYTEALKKFPNSWTEVVDCFLI